MNALSECLRQAKSTGEGVSVYVNQMAEKYPLSSATNELQTVMKYNWVVRYSDGHQLFWTILTLFVGHARYKYSEVKFVTYHILDRTQIFRLKMAVFFKGLFLPLFTIGMLLAGFVTVAWGAGLLFFGFDDDKHPITPLIWKQDLIVEACAFAFFVVFIFIKSSLAKIGFPPGSANDFKHRMVSIESTKVIKADG